MSQELNLMPCPFCGAEPLMQEHPAHKHSIVDWPDHPGSWTIECPACECGMIHATKEGLLAAWNKRAQPAGEAEQRIADLEADVARLHSDKMALLEKYVYAAPPAAANQAGIPEDVAADAARFRFLYDEMGELIWYPPGWNGNKKARFDLYWECEEQDLRKAIDEWRKRIAHTESHALGGDGE